MDDATRRSRGTSNRRAVLGDAHVDRSLARASDVDREFQDLITRYAWGDIWDRPGLDRRTRSFLNLAFLTALNRPNEVRLHVRGALNNGISREEIREVVLQAAIYCGVPAALDTMKVALEVFKEVDEGK